MASNHTRKRKYKKRYGKSKKKQTKKSRKQRRKTRQTKRKKVGGYMINPLRSLARHVNFASTRIADTWNAKQTPIHYDPNVTSQFGKNVLTNNSKVANMSGSNI